MIDTGKDRRERQVLAFLIAILYLTKSEQVTIMERNTSFGALSSEGPVNWAEIVSDVVQKLLLEVGEKATPITPFQFYLYHAKDLLMDEEDMDYKVAKDLVEFKEEYGREEEQQGKDTNTASRKAEPEVEVLSKTALAKSHSKSWSQRATSHHAKPSTAWDDTAKDVVGSELGFTNNHSGHSKKEPGTYRRLTSGSSQCLGGCACRWEVTSLKRFSGKLSF